MTPSHGTPRRGAHISVHGGGSVFIEWYDEEGRPWSATLPLDVCVTYLTIIDMYGLDHAVEIAGAGLRIFKGQVHLPEVERGVLLGCLETLSTQRILLGNLETHVLRWSYEALKAEHWSRQDAADYAQIVLDRPITSEAWRKAVNKWAQDEGLPKLDLPRGRPSKEKPES